MLPVLVTWYCCKVSVCVCVCVVTLCNTGHVQQQHESYYEHAWVIKRRQQSFLLPQREVRSQRGPGKRWGKGKAAQWVTGNGNWNKSWSQETAQHTLRRLKNPFPTVDTCRVVPRPEVKSRLCSRARAPMPYAPCPTATVSPPPPQPLPSVPFRWRCP